MDDDVRVVAGGDGGRFSFLVFFLLLSIAVVAVQFARETARRAHCMSNLRQIGFAIHRHHDQSGKLPTIIAPAGLSAHIRLLPFLEQENLYNQFD